MACSSFSMSSRKIKQINELINSLHRNFQIGHAKDTCGPEVSKLKHKREAELFNKNHYTLLFTVFLYYKRIMVLNVWNLNWHLLSKKQKIQLKTELIYLNRLTNLMVMNSLEQFIPIRVNWQSLSLFLTKKSKKKQAVYTLN